MAKTRYAWVDLAKGFCICFVVFVHVNLWFQRGFDLFNPVWGEVVLAFDSLRMPMFFLISGFLAATAVKKSFRDSFPKTGGLYVLYLFWETVLQLRPLISGGERVHGVADLSFAFVIAPGTLWFIWALPVYYLAGIAVHRRLGARGGWVIVPLAVIAMITPIAFAKLPFLQPSSLGNLKIDAVLLNAVWFFCGLYGKELWSDLIERASPKRLAGGLLVFAACYGVVRFFGVSRMAVPELAPASLFVAAQVLGLVNTEAPLARFLRWIGGQTLQVYVLHLVGISLLNKLVKVTGAEGYIQADVRTMSFVLPLILAPALLALCLFAGRLILTSRFRFLLTPMQMPQWRGWGADVPPRPV